MLTSYLLWLTFGWFGAHHLYLGRDRHAFVWFWTLGGFLVGWLSEFWRIPDYVWTANAKERGVVPGECDRDTVEVSPFRIKRFLGEIAFSCYVGTLATSALPEEIVESHRWLATAINSIAVSIGVHTVANIGSEECRLIVCLVGACLHYPALIVGSLSGLFSTDLWSSLLSASSATLFGRRVRTGAPTQRNLCLRLLILFAGSAVMTSLFLSAAYFNSHVTLPNRERVKARVVVDSFFASWRWQHFKNETRRLSWVLISDGFTEFVHELHGAVEPEGEQRAYKVLDVVWHATDEEIREQYQKLVKAYHPDRLVRNSSEEKKAAEAKFIEVQKSYEKISGRRQKMNKYRLKNEL